MKPLLAFLLVACGHPDDRPVAQVAPELAPLAKLVVTSTAFANGAAIPIEHTCEGADIAPPLAWSGAPPATKEFAVIVDDPDAPDPAAPKQTWVHWVVFGLGTTQTSLGTGGMTPGRDPADGGLVYVSAISGTNDFGKSGWAGPCPPIGRHRYFFKVYALDAPIVPLRSSMTKAELLAAMKGHVVAQGELVGTYLKKQQ